MAHLFTAIVSAKQGAFPVTASAPFSSRRPVLHITYREKRAKNKINIRILDDTTNNRQNLFRQSRTRRRREQK
jgi:hypothetical protein